MIGDTLTFQVSPSHRFDQPPKTYRQQVLMSKTQSVSSLHMMYHKHHEPPPSVSIVDSTRHTQEAGL